MRTPQELNRDARLGEAAQTLIENEALREAFRRVEERVLTEWRAAETVEGRERAWALVRALDEVQHQLHAMVAEGRYAAEVVRRGVASDAITG